MQKKKIAIVGTGNIFDTVHYPNFSKYSDTHEIVAVVDTLSDRAELVSKKYNISHFYTSTEEMVKECKPDIVSVCVPNKFHYETVMQALRGGAHVICEKPPAINANEAKEMMELAEQKNLVLAFNLHHRHSANTGILKTQIEKGTFGNIYNVKVEALRRRGVPGWGSFTNKAISGGGPLIDIGVHMLDTALYLMGFPKVKSIMASSYCEIAKTKSRGTLGDWDPKKFEVEDSLFAFIKFETGATLTIETSFALNIKEKSVMNVWLRGSAAGASVFPLEIYTDVEGELVDTNFPFVDERGNHENSLRRFIERCDGKDAMIATAQEGYYLQQIIDGLYRSAASGDVVYL